MEMRDWSELEKKLCKTLDEMTARKSYDRADIDVIDKLTHSIEKIHKIMKEEGGNSYGNSYGNHGGMWNAEGSYNGMMPMRDEMGRFSRANDMDGMRYDTSRRNY